MEVTLDGSIIAVIGVGIALARLMWNLHRNTKSRIVNLEDRMQAVETGLARLEGYIAGVSRPQTPD